MKTLAQIARLNAALGAQFVRQDGATIAEPNGDPNVALSGGTDPGVAVDPAHVTRVSVRPSGGAASFSIWVRWKNLPAGLDEYDEIDGSLREAVAKNWTQNVATADAASVYVEIHSGAADVLIGPCNGAE